MWEQSAKQQISSDFVKEVKIRRLVKQALNNADFSKVKQIDSNLNKIVIEISNLGGEPIINVNGSRINK